MMRLWIAIAALAMAASASAENVLLKSNGLGAAALGEIGLTAGAMALSQPEPWQGYPKGGEGRGFTNDAGARFSFGDCAVSDGGSVAKALMAQSGAPKATPQEGQIRLSDSDRQAVDRAFDSKAIYQAGQPSTCPAN